MQPYLKLDELELCTGGRHEGGGRGYDGLEFVWPVSHFGVDIVELAMDGADDLTGEYSRPTRLHTI